VILRVSASDNQSKIVIRPLTAGDDIEAITHLLHRAYAGLAAQGFKYYATHQSPDVTRERLHKGFPFVAQRADKIVATVTLYGPAPDPRCDYYGRDGVYKFGQLGVEPDLQKNGLGLRMYARIEQEARQRGARDLALDTAEGAHHLVAWYARLGFSVVETVQWEHTNYRSVVMSKALV
jgi:predicted N-acetyltransferase YhbS